MASMFMSTRLQWRPLQLHTSPGAALQCHARPLTKRASTATSEAPSKTTSAAAAATAPEQSRKSSTAASAVSSPKFKTGMPRRIKATQARDKDRDADRGKSQQLAQMFEIGEPASIAGEPQEGADLIDTYSPEAMEVEAQQTAQDDITLGEAFEQVGREAQTQEFGRENWFPAYQNVITLTGTVSTDLDFVEMQSGDELVKCMLRVRRPQTSIVDSFKLEAWGNFARQMYANVKSGDRIQINGSLKNDSWVDRDGKRQYSIGVVATACWMINQGTIPKNVDVKTTEELQQELAEYPERFWDNRENKRNERAPDYTHKDSGDAIWLSSPNSAAKVGARAPSAAATAVPAAAPTAAAAAAAAAPVAAQGFGGFQGGFGGAGSGQAAPTGFGAPQNFQSPAPAFNGGGSSGGFSSGSFQNRQGGVGGGSVDREALWEEFRASPNSFWDNRSKKFNPKAPDFKHKQTGEGLWVSSSPPWFNVSEYPERAPGAAGGSRQLSDEKRQLWEQLDKDPSLFWDNRATKTNPKAPDFVHKGTRGALWINSKPDWVSLDSLGHEQLPAV